ncbi:hypothetical protein [uncultured Bacteroides sp.]|uniref:hypothetical protein n=1 Tax=uncultured Bacteroides sp. TaxID=162156 RepID=UPI002613C2EC|nr:hypothetical protein [uncultured Bacteroides sp.]
MENDIDYREELNKARENIKGLERNGIGSTIDAFWEVCCGIVLVAEQNLRNQDRDWEIVSLANEFMDIANYLGKFDHMLDKLNSAAKRMVETIYDHPELKMKMMEARVKILRRIEARCPHDIDLCEDLVLEIGTYSYNIYYANRGEFDRVRQTGHLKYDPIEWTTNYESVIDEANKKIYDILKDHPRGMGFCHAYWHVKKKVLSEDYGIEWRSPAEMNPGVLFD